MAEVIDNNISFLNVLLNQAICALHHELLVIGWFIQTLEKDTALLIPKGRQSLKAAAILVTF